ncbi:hypothetical protein H0H93_013867 [Arthromyces matolae]|nr:hypothetical protein H0H93_013867 [Arthromyces matolae]
MVSIPEYPSSSFETFQGGDAESAWAAPLPSDDDSDDEWQSSIDSSVPNDRNGYGYGKQAKIARNPFVGCRFCDVENVLMIELSIPIWRLQVMQPRPEGFIWDDRDAPDPDGLDHICLRCYKRVLEFARPQWDTATDNTDVGSTNGWDTWCEALEENKDGLETVAGPEDK